MKKLFCILISFVLVAGTITSFAGCGPKSQKDNKADRALDTSLVGACRISKVLCKYFL